MVLMLCNHVVSARQWEAHDIRITGPVPRHYVEDYATSQYGDTWDFDEGDLEGIDYWHGIREPIVEEGRLKLVILKTAKLGWGEPAFAHPEYGQEFIAREWSKYWSPCVVRLKLSQMRDTSSWYVGAVHMKHGRKKMVRYPFLVKGKDEQIVTVSLGVCRKQIIALEIGTDTPKNKAEIDWIRVERLSAPRYFVKEIDIDEDVLKGNVALGVNAGYELYVNGIKISENNGRPPFSNRINTVDIGSQLKRGHNILAIKVETYGWTAANAGGTQDYFFMQGLIFTESGRAIKIRTDHGWRGSYCVDGDDCLVGGKWRAWGFVEDKGGLVKNHLDGETKYGKGDFIGPPYMGRISIKEFEGKPPIIDANKEAELTMHVYSGRRVVLSGSFHFIPMGAGMKKDVQNNISWGERVDGVSKGLLKIPAMRQGAYRIRMRCELDDGSSEQRSMEVVVVGKIYQRKVAGTDYFDGLDTVEVARIDPLNSKINAGGISRHGRLLNKLFSEPRVDKGNSAESGFVESGAIRGDWISLPFTIVNTGRPHVVEVHYPAGRRNMSFSVAEIPENKRLRNIGPNTAVARATAGVFTESKSSRGSQVFRFVFWPTKKELTFNVVNTGRSKLERAAIEEVRVYEITNELPAVTDLPDSDGVMIGPFSERIDRSLPRVFYAGALGNRFAASLADAKFDGFYTSWYETFRKLIMYLRFTGQNTYFAGLYMYNAGIFPSQRYQGYPEDGLAYHGKGWDSDPIALMARMFEANGLNLVLGVQFMASPALRDHDNVSDKDVAEGKSTIRLVDLNGRQVWGLKKEGYNYLAPVVRQEMLGLVEEISKRYARFKSIRGITWMRVPEYLVSAKWRDTITPIDVGYGDQTITMFEKEEGVRIPVDHTDRKRFIKRRNWLLHFAKEKWIKWRCRKVYALDAELSDRMHQINPDWKYWRFSNRPLPSQLLQWSKGKLSQIDMYRQGGLDPRLYRVDGGPRFIEYYSMYDVRKYYDARANDVYARAISDWQSRDGYGSNGIFLRSGFQLENKLKTSQQWPWKRLTIVSIGAPRYWTHEINKLIGVGKCDEFVVPIGWSDDGHMVGHEQQIRDLVRSYSDHCAERIQ